MLIRWHILDGSWKGKRTDNFVANMPPGEPRIKYQETVTVPYVENRMETTTIRVPVKDKNGNITYRMEQRTRTRPVTKYRYQTKDRGTAMHRLR